jgi:molybdopterin molybdotransferase
MAPRAEYRRRTRSREVAAVLARLRRSLRDRAPATEWVSVADALGRVPTSPLRARRVLPPSDLSMMDGFAVRAGAWRGRTSDAPREFRVVGRSFPGDDARRLPRVTSGTAVEVLTGAALPPGADAVLRLEDCRRTGDRLRTRIPASPGRDIARRGEDFRPGGAIVAAGVPLRPWHIAALVANEISRVRAVRLPRVGLLTTGDEVVGAGGSIRSGKVRDTTKPLLLGMLAELRVPTEDLGSVADRESALRRAVQRGVRSCDVLITIGGSSVGQRDLVPRAVRSIPGARWIARGVRLRPGSKSAVVLVGRRPVFLLSGPPVAAFAGFVGLVEPFLRDLLGAAVPERSSLTATLDRGIVHSRGVRELVRVRFEFRRGVPRAVVVDQHGASRISSLTEATALLVLEEGRGNYHKGETVRVLRL